MADIVMHFAKTAPFGHGSATGKGGTAPLRFANKGHGSGTGKEGTAPLRFAKHGRGSARNAETNLGAAGMTARATGFQHETEFLET
jgi:hypothetical protein